MKRSFIIPSLVISLTAGVSVFVFTNYHRSEAKVYAYSTSSLPTTIDLNDCSESTIRSYYSSLNNLATNQRQGTNLLKNLKTILKNGQKYYSYDSGNAIWQIYEIADRDWSKSPASSTTYGTYNSSTNKITNYVYGTSSSSSKNNPYIHALYINRNVTNQTTAWDDHQQTQWGINREHVWPKAEGFETSGAGGARGDPMHLMAGNGYSNNIHSNYYYGYVNTSSSYTNCGSKYSNQSGNLRGTSKTLNTGTVFEPQDCDKGDIARAIFYMVARYNYLSGSDSDGIDSNNPNLTLTQDMNDWSSTGYSSTTTKSGKMGILTDLLAWHHADPVDEYEIHRNNLLYTNYTNNRNPFIDFPEWVDYIWGKATYSGTTYQSYNSNPTGYATPSSDTINGYNSGGQSSDPAVLSVTVTPSSLSLDMNGTKTGNLNTSVEVANGAATTVTWESSNTSVATVSNNGVVTAKAVGEAAVTAVSTVDGSKYGTCYVSVIDSSQQGGGESGTDEGSATASSGAISGWTASGAGSAYADGSVKLDSSGDYIEKKNIFSGDVSTYMTSLDVTINAKINGTPTAANSYKVEAIDSSGNVILGQTKTGAGVFTDSYGDVTFNISGDLSGCTGIRVTYATKGAGNMGLKTISWTATYSSYEATPTSITATVNKTFHPGEIITKSDITVEDDLGNTITDFNFDGNNYQFTYDDAESGGTVTEHTFEVTYLDMEADLEVEVSRVNYSSPSGSSKTYQSTSFSGLPSSYTTNQYVTVDGIRFAIDGYYYSGSSKLSLSNGKTSAPGKVINDTKYSTGITNVTVEGASPDIQLSVDGEKWVDLANATVNKTNYFFFKLFYKTTAQTSYVNITSFTVSLKGSETTANVANYIMFEDTENQCSNKLDYAISYFENLSSSDKSSFMNSDDYVITEARARLIDWAKNQGKQIVLQGGEYTVKNVTNNLLILVKDDSVNPIIYIVIPLMLGGIFILLYKKKRLIK